MHATCECERVHFWHDDDFLRVMCDQRKHDNQVHTHTLTNIHTQFRMYYIHSKMRKRIMSVVVCKTACDFRSFW